MSIENEGIPVTWEEIKAASRKLDWERKEDKGEKRVARRYLAQNTARDDAQAEDYSVIPGYN
jgi:hypothetical protein